MNFSVGERVVYPNHGVGVIEEISQRELTGRKEAFYLLRILSNGVTVMIPQNNADEIGLRRLIKREEVSKLLDQLGSSKVSNHSDWKNRFKENSDKMRTGCIFQVAEVLKGLSHLSHDRVLSFREKRMLDKARYLLVSEVAVVENVPEAKAEEIVDRALQGVAARKANAAV
ncbi:MAG: CarD family transcriptional regulator [Acidobacteriota bacterium]